MITVSELSMHFGDISAIDRVSLQICEGEVFAWLGHNGAGKTTMVRLLNGVLTPTSGSASVMGYSPVEDGPRLRQHTGVLTETPSLDGRMTAFELLEFYARIFGLDAPRARSRTGELLERMGLADRAGDRIATFSRGMRQRLAIARALLHEPLILFLDEPTGGLDPVAALDIRNLIANFTASGQRTVILCTHDLAEAEQLSSRVAILEQGTLLEVGTPAELIDRRVTRINVRISVASDQVDEARRMVDGDTEAAAGGIASGGQQTLVFTVGSRGEIPRIVTGLVNEGIEIFEVLTIRPTLEDVYLGFHGRTRDDSNMQRGDL